MNLGQTAMHAALRALSAIAEKREPEPADIDELRRLAPDLAGLPVDELACEIVQKALKQRAERSDPPPRKNAKAAG